MPAASKNVVQRASKPKSAAAKGVVKAMPVARSKARPVPGAALPLPFDLEGWTETGYVIPSALLRSALFAVLSKSQPRPHYESKQLATVDNFQLSFTGKAFDQSDEDVWMALLKVAKHRGMGTPIPFSLRSMLRELSWDTSGKSMKRLKSSFERLVEATVKIQMGVFVYRGHLVESIESNELAGEDYVFRLSPAMAKLLAPGSRTSIKSEHRKSIRGSLAKWLHGFVEASPKSYFTVSLQQCCDLSGSTFASMSRFKFALKNALNELQSCDVIETWKFDGDLVVIQRAAHSPNSHLKIATPIVALT